MKSIMVTNWDVKLFLLHFINELFSCFYWSLRWMYLWTNLWYFFWLKLYRNNQIKAVMPLKRRNFFLFWKAGFLLIRTPKVDIFDTKQVLLEDWTLYKPIELYLFIKLSHSFPFIPSTISSYSSIHHPTYWFLLVDGLHSSKCKIKFFIKQHTFIFETFTLKYRNITQIRLAI